MHNSDAAQALVKLLAEHKQRIVLAESCTGGMVSAELTKVAGVSDWFCGSAVTYRNDTKANWLSVRRSDIAAHTAVSHHVALQMATGVLGITPEANIAASITGHFGPQAPPGFDGLIFIGTANRAASEIVGRTKEHRLQSVDRLSRQAEATGLVLQTLTEMIQSKKI